MSVVIARRKRHLSPAEREAFALFAAMLSVVVSGLVVLSLLLPDTPLEPGQPPFAPVAAGSSTSVNLPQDRRGPTATRADSTVGAASNLLSIRGVSGVLAVPRVYRQVMMIACCRHPGLAGSDALRLQRELQREAALAVRGQ
jgi:hypothetical protein